VRPRWPYDIRPSVRAEKYIRDASGWRKDVTDGNDNGTDEQTDRRADRVRRNMRPPPREEGRIITISLYYRRWSCPFLHWIYHHWRMAIGPTPSAHAAEQSPTASWNALTWTFSPTEHPAAIILLYTVRTPKKHKATFIVARSLVLADLLGRRTAWTSCLLFIQLQAYTSCF